MSTNFSAPHAVHPRHPFRRAHLLERDIDAIPNRPRVNFALLGAAGGHLQTFSRDLAQLEHEFVFQGYDLRAPVGPSAVPVEIVPNTAAEMSQLLWDRRTKLVYSATWHDQHPQDIEAAIGAGVQFVYVEKPLAHSVEDAKEVLFSIQESRPLQDVFVVDAYRLLRLIRVLVRATPELIGEFVAMRISLLEDKDIAVAERRVHRDGMVGFMHHCLALLSYWLPLDGLAIADASSARHEKAPAEVPDTYRSLRLEDRSGQIVLDAEVGKFVETPCKIIEVVGTDGTARYDRNTGELIVTSNKTITVVLNDRNPQDRGYLDLFGSIAKGVPFPPTLLRAEQAFAILKILDEAHLHAKTLQTYPTGPRVITS